MKYRQELKITPKKISYIEEYESSVDWTNIFKSVIEILKIVWPLISLFLFPQVCQ